MAIGMFRKYTFCFAVFVGAVFAAAPPKPPNALIHFDKKILTVQPATSETCYGSGNKRGCSILHYGCARYFGEEPIVAASAGLLSVTFTKSAAPEISKCKVLRISTKNGRSSVNDVHESASKTACEIDVSSLSVGKYVVTVGASWGEDGHAEYDFGIEKTKEK